MLVSRGRLYQDSLLLLVLLLKPEIRKRKTELLFFFFSQPSRKAKAMKKKIKDFSLKSKNTLMSRIQIL